jgi:hypothetical protein
MISAATLEKQRRRAEREAELGARQLALPDRRYGVILADPGWHFEPYSQATGMDRAAKNHYACQLTAEIAALDVPSIAARDCDLFLWSTGAMLGMCILASNAISTWCSRRVGAARPLRRTRLNMLDCGPDLYEAPLLPGAASGHYATLAEAMAAAKKATVAQRAKKLN